MSVPEGSRPSDLAGPGNSKAPVGAEAGSETRELLSAQDVGRTIARIAHEIIEKTALDGPEGTAPRVVLIGIPTRGTTLATRLRAKIEEFSGVRLPIGSLDITLYRDDLRNKPHRPLERTSVPEGGVDNALSFSWTTSSSPVAPCARHSTRCAIWAAPARSNSQCSWIVVTANSAARRLRRQERPDREVRGRQGSPPGARRQGSGSHLRG